MVKQIFRWAWSFAMVDKSLEERVRFMLDLLGVDEWVRQDRYDALVAYIVHGIDEMRADVEAQILPLEAEEK